MTAGLQCWEVTSTSRSSLSVSESVGILCCVLMLWHSSKSLSSSSCLLVNNHLHPKHLATVNVCLI